MKKVILYLVFCMALTNQSWGVNVGPETVGKGKFSLEIEGDVIIQPLKLNSNPTYSLEDTVYVPSTNKTTVTKREGDYFNEKYTAFRSTYTYKRKWEDIKNKSNLLFLKVCYEILDRLDLYGKVGIGDKKIVYTECVDYYRVSASDDWYRFNSKEDIENNNFHTGFVWAAGLKGILLEIPIGLKIGANIQYLSLKNELEISYNEDSEQVSEWSNLKILEQKSEKFEVFQTQWQIALIIAQKIKSFLPYIGGEYIVSEIEWNYNNIDIIDGYYYDTNELFSTQKAILKKHAKFIPEKRWNGIVGIEYSIKEYVFLNLEGKLFGQEAYSIKANFKFF